MDSRRIPGIFLLLCLIPAPRQPLDTEAKQLFSWEEKWLHSSISIPLQELYRSSLGQPTSPCRLTFLVDAYRYHLQQGTICKDSRHCGGLLQQLTVRLLRACKSEPLRARKQSSSKIRRKISYKKARRKIQIFKEYIGQDAGHLCGSLRKPILG